MKPELLKLVKQAMGYSDTPAPICKDCEHSFEKENPHLDRAWMTMCKSNILGRFEVSPHGRCNLFLTRKVT